MRHAALSLLLLLDPSPAQKPQKAPPVFGVSVEYVHIDAFVSQRGEPVTGRARRMHSAAGEVHGFALMLHGLKRAESVAIQETGLGRHHLLGCGLFVPHKSIAAVGE